TRDSIRLSLAYRPPLAWDALVGFLAGRSTAGVERVEDRAYLRTAAIGSHRGWLKIEPIAGRNALAVELATSLPPVLPEALDRLSPLPERLADAADSELTALGIAAPRAASIRAIAQAVARRDLDLQPSPDPEALAGTLREYPGLGDWTAQYIAMRALRWPDAFPAGDVALHKALGVQQSRKPAFEAEAASQAWKPWRSYAVVRAWRALSQGG